MVRGNHVYKYIWSAEKGENLKCVRETSNHFDPFAVAVFIDTTGTCPKESLPFVHFLSGEVVVFHVQSMVIGDTHETFLRGGQKFMHIDIHSKEQSSIDKIVALLKGIEDITTRLASDTQESNETSEESENCSPSKVLKLTEKDLPHDTSDEF